MARTTRTGELSAIDTNDNYVDDKQLTPALINDDDPTDIGLLNIIADLGGDDLNALVNVYRATAERGLKGGAFLYSCLPSEFSREELLQNYGAGQYRVHVRSDGKILRNALITLEEPRAPALRAAPDTGLVHISKLIEAMQTGFGQLGLLITQANNQPKFDPNESRRAVMQDMLMMKQIMGGGENQNGADKSIEMVMKGIELAREITPRDGETSSLDILLEGLKTFGRPIAEAAITKMASLSALPQNVPVLQALPVNTPAIVNPTPLNQPGDDMNIMLKMYAAQLVSQAANERDPYVYANLLADNLPDEFIDQMIAQSDDEILKFMADLNSDVLKYRPWMLDFIGQFREILTPAPDDDSVVRHAPDTIPALKPSDTDNGGA